MFILGVWSATDSVKLSSSFTSCSDSVPSYPGPNSVSFFDIIFLLFFPYYPWACTKPLLVYVVSIFDSPSPSLGLPTLIGTGLCCLLKQFLPISMDWTRRSWESSTSKAAGAPGGFLPNLFVITCLGDKTDTTCPEEFWIWFVLIWFWDFAGSLFLSGFSVCVFNIMNVLDDFRFYWSSSVNISCRVVVLDCCPFLNASVLAPPAFFLDNSCFVDSRILISIVDRPKSDGECYNV